MEPVKILLADDESHITHIVGTKLRGAGFETVIAADGAEGLQLALEHRPTLVVTDLQMPRMSGLEFATELATRPETSATPVILLTARGYLLDEPGLEGTNIRRVLSKPFTARGLLKLVQELLADASESRAAA